MSVAYNPKIVTSGLVGYWDAANKKSYSGSGTTWTDLSSVKNNGTITSSPTYSASDGSFDFNGSTQFVTFSNPTLTNQITIEVFGNFTATTPNGTAWIVGREGAYRLLYSGSLNFSWICATVNNSWYTTGTAIGSGALFSFSKTYHVVGTYDGSFNRIYVNGVLYNTGSAISGNIASVGSSYLLMQRDGAAGNIDYGKGKIFSHKVYNRALSAPEIQQNYNATKGRFGL